MKKFIISLAAISAASIMSAGAQELSSSYFLKNYMYGYRINPAATSDRGFVGIALNNLGVSYQGNVGLASFLYPTSEGLVTGLHSSIPSSTFLGNLEEVNRLSGGFDESILALGLKGNNSYTTVELNLKGNAALQLPYDIFDFLKNGSKEKSTFNISDLNVNAKAYVELAAGYSRMFGDKLSIGARLKLLAGLGRVNAYMDNLNVSMTDQQWSVSGNANVDFAVKGMAVGTKASAHGNGNDILDLSSTSFKASGTSGFGAAADLGIEYRPLDWLKVSASVVDLGGISWKNSVQAVTSGSTWTYSGADGLSIGGDSASGIGGQMTDAFDGLFGIAELHVKNQASSSYESLPMTLHAGVDATYGVLTAGVLFTHQNQQYASWSEARLGASCSFANWLSVALSSGFGTYGTRLGFALSTCLGSVNLFAGCDSMFTQVSREFIPLNKTATNAYFGWNILF